MFRAVLSTVVAIIAMLNVNATASATSVDDIKARGRILIGVDLGHPPYGMLDTKAEPIGSDVETAKLLAKDMGVELEMVAVSGANRVPFLVSNRVDLVISSFSITDERAKVVDFSLPYGVVPVDVAARASMNIKGAADLSGKAIAAVRGTTTDIELTQLLKKKGIEAQIIRYEDEATANMAIVTGQQDIIATALYEAIAISEQNPKLDLKIAFELASYPMGVGIRKGNEPLKLWVDQWVEANLKNGNLNEIYKKYFKQSLPAEMLK